MMTPLHGVWEIGMITVDRLTRASRDILKRTTWRYVDDVSFECHSGEVFGIIGPNGAGKTTLMRMLSTLLPPTSGTATVAGHDILDDPDGVRENIGFVSPSHGLYIRMTARENIRYFGLLNGISWNEIDEIVADVIKWLGLTEWADKTPPQLSSGVKQRVSIARAIVHQPPVLLFDEPTNGIDDASTEAILQFIRECRKEGQVVLFCSHILSQIEQVCDRVAILNRGRILAIGTPAELCESMECDRLETAYRAILDADKAVQREAQRRSLE
jgi:sodium transport system ATP-binding protein